MTVTAQYIRDELTTYLDVHPEDKPRLEAPLQLLDETGSSIAARTEFRGHVTVGAILTDDARRVLHIHHAALDRWLLPGGHLEPSDISLAAAALRELTEETGIREVDISLVAQTPIDIDAHPIPANDTKGEPEHRHFDFRYLFRASVTEVTLQHDEVTGAAWCPIETMHDERLRTRIRSALR